ncbi:hypothetical protein FLLO111716_04455 [Flavobacterium longum]
MEAVSFFAGSSAAQPCIENRKKYKAESGTKQDSKSAAVLLKKQQNVNRNDFIIGT